MDPEKIINAVADLVNGDIDHTQAMAVVDKELVRSVELKDSDKKAIRGLIRGYSGSGGVSEFTSRISEILSKSAAAVKYADEDAK